MDVSKDIKNIGLVMLVLFIIGIITGVTYIGFGYLKQTACEQGADTNVWSNEVCQVSATNTTEVTVTAVTKIGVVEGVLEIVLGLLALLTVVAIFAIVVKAAKGMGGSSKF